jgi:hypothetical protein
MEFEINMQLLSKPADLSLRDKKALAAASWVKMGIDIILVEYGIPIKDTRSRAERMSPVDTYFYVLEQPERINIALRTGPKTGLVALSVYTNAPGLGMHALEERGFFCPQCDPLIRHETIARGQSQGRFHTVLFYSGKDQFLETGLDDLPGVYVRSSGELILLPPHELNFDSDFGLVARSMYEREDTLAPFGIPYLPDGLRKMIRAAERQTLADKRKPKLRAGVLPELYAPIAEGGRNNTLARRAGYLLGVRKLTEAQTLEALLDINQRCCQPPLGLCEVSNIARSIAKKHHRHG